MPFPGTRVIPTKWAAHHRPTAESAMTATCSVKRAGTGDPVYNPSTGLSDLPDAVPVLIGVRCRIQAFTRLMGAQDVAGQMDSQRSYMVSLPVDVAKVLVDDRLTVDECADDPQLVDRVMRVTDVLYGSTPWQRDLTCVDDLG